MPIVNNYYPGNDPRPGGGRLGERRGGTRPTSGRKPVKSGPMFEHRLLTNGLFGLKKERLPIVKVSSMDYLTQGFNFIVTLNQYMFGFKSVSGISIEREVEYIHEGGVNDHQLMVGAPQGSGGYKLDFERGLMIRTASSPVSFAKAAATANISNNIARKSALIALSSLSPQEALEKGPAIGLIQVYNRQNKLTAMYSFLSLGMTSWSIDNLDAERGDILIESISIVHTGLTRVPLGAGNIAVLAKDLDSDAQSQQKAKFIEELKERRDRENKQKAEAYEESMKKLREKDSQLKKEMKEQKEKLEEEEKKNNELAIQFAKEEKLKDDEKNKEAEEVREEERIEAGRKTAQELDAESREMMENSQKNNEAEEKENNESAVNYAKEENLKDDEKNKKAEEAREQQRIENEQETAEDLDAKSRDMMKNSKGNK